MSDHEAAMRLLQTRGGLVGTLSGVVIHGGSPEWADFALRRFAPAAAPLRPPDTSSWSSEPYVVAADVSGHRFRLERPGLVAVRVGDRWWTHAAPEAAMWGDAEDAESEGSLDVLLDLLARNGLPPSLRLTGGDPDSVAGRAGIRIRAHRDGNNVAPGSVPLYAPGCDHYDVVVDRELGFLLRVACYVGDQLVVDTAFEELVLDGPLSDDLFPEEAPPGVPMVRIADAPR